MLLWSDDQRPEEWTFNAIVEGNRTSSRRSGAPGVLKRDVPLNFKGGTTWEVSVGG